MVDREHDAAMDPLTGLFTVALLCAISGCEGSNEPPVVAADTVKLDSHQIVIGLEHYVTAQGIRRAHLKADTAFFLRESTEVELRGVELTFYDPTGGESTRLTSKEGTYDWESADMTARGNVVVVDPADGRRVETSVMRYDRSEDRIWSDVPTTMVEPDGTVVEGVAFQSDASLDEINLTSARLQERAAPPNAER